MTTLRESEKLQVGEDLKYHWSAIPENEGSGFQTVLSNLQCSSWSCIAGGEHESEMGHEG